MIASAGHKPSPGHGTVTANTGVTVTTSTSTPTTTTVVVDQPTPLIDTSAVARPADPAVALVFKNYFSEINKGTSPPPTTPCSARPEWRARA